jgi:tRNA-2-methylthio-N6-dimethylallyladenosine synthase
MPNQVPKEVVQERFERLVALQDEMSWEENKKLIGTEVEVLVATGEGRKDRSTERLSGRAQDGRLVHVGLGEGQSLPRPGDVVTATVSDAKPFFLIADPTSPEGFPVRQTRAGDAWDRAQAESCGAPSAAEGPRPVSLGLPTLRQDS